MNVIEKLNTKQINNANNQINNANNQINLPTTVGSRSTKTALGTCLPAPVSLKKVLKESSPPPMVLSLGIWPSGWIPCSRQYNSQHALPICTPACPTWIEIHSRWKQKQMICDWLGYHSYNAKLVKVHCVLLVTMVSFLALNLNVNFNLKYFRSWNYILQN